MDGVKSIIFIGGTLLEEYLIWGKYEKQTLVYEKIITADGKMIGWN